MPLSDLERGSLKRRSVLLHSLPEAETDLWIENADQIALEAEADFQAEVEQGYTLLVDILKGNLGRIKISPDSEELLRDTMMEICARKDEPSEEINLLARKILESRENAS